MPREFSPKNHISEPPPKTSQSPTPHISIPCERNQSTNFGARRVARWRGLRRSGRGLCSLGAIQAQLGGAAWRLREPPPGASGEELLEMLEVLLLSDTDYFLSAVSKWSWEGGDSESGSQLKSQTLRLLSSSSVSSSSSSSVPPLSLSWRARCAYNVTQTASAFLVQHRPNSGLRSASLHFCFCNSHNLAFIRLRAAPFVNKLVND